MHLTYQYLLKPRWGSGGCSRHFTLKGKRWFVSISVQVPDAPEIDGTQQEVEAVAIDVGINMYALPSTGAFPTILASAETRRSGAGGVRNISRRWTGCFPRRLTTDRLALRVLSASLLASLEDRTNLAAVLRARCTAATG